MEMANYPWRVRPAREEDKGHILALLRGADRRHLHVDWRLPGEWFEMGVFVVAEREAGGANGGAGSPPELVACLALGADPPPAAWVRVVALDEERQARAVLEALFAAAVPALRRDGVTQLGWLAQRTWPRPWLHALGFAVINEVETFLKEDLTVPAGPRQNPAAAVRAVRRGEMARLAEIEAAAFDPLWRHSAEALELGRDQALTFDVAELDGRVVGFQYSVPGDEAGTVHLVRLTVSPDVQRRGVGSSLLAAAIDAYRAQGLRGISLNTQADNLASKRLYRKFGFEPSGYRLPVWSMEL